MFTLNTAYMYFIYTTGKRKHENHWHMKDVSNAYGHFVIDYP